ncbi:hypothetical protein AAF712_000074 [Marasmius tenuissimus]|uniref:F-box domain-containing protein n=1 Tax=Marasmius tenuissimus TaxID=585030 RepID=A0ABR3AIB9_9AGAR
MAPSTFFCDKCNPLFDTTIIQSLPVYPADHIPTPSEVSEALVAVEDGKRILARYDEEILHLQIRLSEVGRQRQRLDERINQTRQSVSIIKRLPTEIWQEIFAFACPASTWSLAITGHDVIATPLKISHVCSRWRSIIRAAPRLWSSISLDIMHPCRDAVNLIETHISASKGHPLTIYIWENYEISGPFRPFHGAMAALGLRGVLALRKLMQHVGQCEELQIEVSWEILAAVVDRRLRKVSFPVLRSLKAIRPPEDDQIERLGWFREALARAPLLRDLRLEHLETAPRFLPLSQITTLALDDSHGFDCVSPGLAACTSLERFEVTLTDPCLDSVPVPPHTTTLTSLRTLTIHSCGLTNITSHPIPRILAAVTFPSLISLTIKVPPQCFMSDEETPRAIVALIERSQCSLTSLCLRFPTYSVPYLQNILRMCTELSELEIVWAYQPRTKISNLLSVLTLCTESNNDDLVPQLSKFVLHSEDNDLVWGYCDAVVNSLVEMLSSRLPSGTQTGYLTDVNIQLHPQKFVDYEFIQSVGDKPTRDLCGPVLRERLGFLHDYGVRCSVENRDNFYK